MTLSPGGGPTRLVAAGAALAGAAAPLGEALAAARWSRLLPDRRLLPAGLTLEALSTDATFVAGPVLTGPLAGLVQPLAPIAVGGPSPSAA